MWNNFICVCNIDVLLSWLDYLRSPCNWPTSPHCFFQCTHDSSSEICSHPGLIMLLYLMFMSSTCVRWSSFFLIWVIIKWSPCYPFVLIYVLLILLHIWCDVSLGDDMVDGDVHTSLWLCNMRMLMMFWLGWSLHYSLWIFTKEVSNHHIPLL